MHDLFRPCGSYPQEELLTIALLFVLYLALHSMDATRNQIHAADKTEAESERGNLGLKRSALYPVSIRKRFTARPALHLSAMLYTA